MTQAENSLELLLAGFAEALRPVADAATRPPVPSGLFELMSDAGLDLDRLFVDPAPAVAALQAVANAYAMVRPILEAGAFDDPRQLKRLAEALGRVVQTARALDGLQLRPDLPDLPASVARQLLDYLLVGYVERTHPAAYRTLVLAGVISPGDVALRVAAQTHPERIGLWIRNPGAAMAAAYGWGREDFQGQLFLERLAALLPYLNIPAYAEAVEPALLQRLLGPASGGERLWQLRIPVFNHLPSDGAYIQAGFSLLPLPARDGVAAGLGVLPFVEGAAAAEVSLGDQWWMTVQVAGDISLQYGLIARPGHLGVEAISGDGLPGSTLGARVAVERRAPAAERLPLLSGPGGVQLALGTLGMQLGWTYRDGQAELQVLLPVRNALLSIQPPADDGFLGRVLPPDGISAPFDVALGWSSRKGLFFEGSGGLDATLPVHASLGGILGIDLLQLGVHPGDAGLRASASATVTVQLGPIRATVEQVGMEAVLGLPADGGNLGVADLSIGFKPPTGAALTIDAGVVTGGGYLLFDPVRGQYAGAVQLSIARTLTLSAFGLVTTRMPDGSKGFSLVVLISTRFTPSIQLGYGFALSGIGGLLGLNRTVAVDPLRAGLRAGTLGRLLFPEDPIRNAPQIVSDLQTVFPAAPGRFLFGPMAQITWGVPTQLTIDLGAILELPAPVRLFLLGRMRLALPEERAAIVRLQLDALGVIDFERGDVALDAVLYDSRIAQFAVTGEMALRANVGAAPSFALAIGGFHPRFPTPSGFPALERVAISLATGNNPRLRLEAYLAVTTNTVQFGAQLELYAAAAGFSIQGMLGFDALIRFAPFGLAVDLRAHVALKRGNTSLMAVQVDMALTGPAPWRARGTAKFKVLFFSGSIRFDAQFGKAEAPPLPSPVQIRPLLLEALRDGRNWATQLPPAELPVVSLRDQPGATEVFVHPLADLQVRQRVVPLGRVIEQYGNTSVEGEREFALAVVDLAGAVLSTVEAGVEPVSDAFAPAQYRAMTDDEKLVAPAFEEMQAGIRFALRTYASGPAVVEPEMTYERKTVYGPGRGAAPALAGAAPLPAALVPSLPPMRGDPRGPSPLVVRPELVERMAAVGSAGRAALGRTEPARDRDRLAPVQLRPPRFVAVAIGPRLGLQAVSGRGTSRVLGSYSEAIDAGRDPTSRDPRAQRRVRVVRSLEPTEAPPRG